MNGEYGNPYDNYAPHSTNQSQDDYNALLSSHQVDIQSSYYHQPESNPNASTNTQDVAKKFLFSVEDFLDTVRTLKADFSSNGTLKNIGNEPTPLFNDIKYHLTKQNRIASDSLNRLIDGVKMLKKLKTRCSSAFNHWSSVDNLIETVDATTKAHPDFNGIIAQREEEAKHRLAFLKRQQMAKQQQQHQQHNHHPHHQTSSPPPYYDHSYYNQPPPRDYNYNNPYHNSPHQNYRAPPPQHHNYRAPPHSDHGAPHNERRTIYVYGFPRKWGPTELRYLFDCIGETEDVDVLKRKGDTAFIHYIYPADAREAVEQMNNSCPLYCKRPINVEMADKSRLGIGMTKSAVCWLYNQRICQLGMTCSRQHVCLFCNGGHPRKQCGEIDKHFRKLRCDKMDAFGGIPFRCSDFEITIDDIPINAANERDLRLLFNTAGPITRIKIMKPRKRNMKVRAYMEFADQQSLNNALKLNGTVWMNDTISVRKSTNNYRNTRYDRERDRERPRERERSRDRMNRMNRSRSRDRDRDRDREREREREREDRERKEREREREREMYKSKNKSKTIQVGGCIQKENGKIIIERKYQLNEVCTLFNGVTGCYSRDCEKIHVCSLCEDEKHSLPKCPRSNTKIGEILMKQLQKENKKPGAAMSRIELNEKVKDKKRSINKIDKTKGNQPPKKKIKLSENGGVVEEDNAPKRITHLDDVRADYLLFLLDGNVWRRALVTERTREHIKLHYLGWDKRYDETVLAKDSTRRISLYKPEKFYSEATINKSVKAALKDIRTSAEVHALDIEKVKQNLKLCQLKNDGPVDLLRERLLNVTDEVKIQNAVNKSDIISVNMRRIIELYSAESKNKETDNTVKMNTTMKTECTVSTKSEDNKKYDHDKKKVQQICGNYNSVRGCNDAECELIHECELCGSELHINTDCPNNNL